MIKTLAKATIFASFFALLISGLITAGAMQHNVQCEFYCDGEVHWSHILTLALGWFAIAFPVGVVFAALFFAIQARRL